MPNSQNSHEDIELSDAPPIGDSDVEEEVMPKAPNNGVSKSIVTDKPSTKIEDMFNDDDDDDDDGGDAYGMSDDDDIKLFAETEAAMQQDLGGIGASDPGVMLTFYRRLFPFRQLFQWLNHSPVLSNDFAHREFAFTLANEAYLRYQAFTAGDLLREQVINLNPTRFEIGPVYNVSPADRRQHTLRPVEKELVFDIDMTDYDEVRTCCDKANICNKCWSFITIAIQVLDIALREDLGFKHILWVYSGRRGAHAWVCDKRARIMDDQKRRAVASYLEVVKGGSNTNKKVNLKRPLHPHLARSLDILKEEFESCVLEGQDPWREPQGAEKLLKLIPDKVLAASLRKKWESQPNRSSPSKWKDIDVVAKTCSDKLDTKLLLEAKQDIILEYTYPRLDSEVSKHLNHLLKSPFCVHPGTGRVCVPIEASKAAEFDPLTVPTVTELLQEINQWDEERAKAEGKATTVGKLSDYEKTSLKPHVVFFREFVAKLMKEEKGTKNNSIDDTDNMEF